MRIKTNPEPLKIAVLAGDGIGPQIMPVCIEVLQQVSRQFGTFTFSFEFLDAGAACYQKTGESLPSEVMQCCQRSDAILLGAMGLPSVRYADGTEIAPQLELRSALDLYAGVRPVKLIKHLPLPLRNADHREIDFVLIRESTEGLFASRGKGVITDDRLATDTMEISRAGCERLFRFGFELALQRQRSGHIGRLTCVDKANVFSSMAFFRKIYDEIGLQYAAVQKDHMYVDAAALNMVRQPWKFDVLVTENMFGDILSDLGAGIMGGMGMAPSADIGSENAVFQPCHGSAPDIAGQDKANPVAMILSGAMMLDWLGLSRNQQDMTKAAQMINLAVENAFTNPALIPWELGGDSGTGSIVAAIMGQLEKLS